jgi:hypothetical protein
MAMIAGSGQGIEPGLLPTEMTDHWSALETSDPLHADQRNFYKVEKPR